jgi:betaine-aldehyde dehydrogenase
MTRQTPTYRGHMLIGGDLVQAANGQWLPSVNPASEDTIGEFPAGGEPDVRLAVAAAEVAQPSWAALDIKDRAFLLETLAERIRERTEELVDMEVRDTGNTIRPVRADIESAIWQLKWYAGLASEIKGDTVPATARNLHLTLREPYGVVARIVPFNHPIMFAVRGIAGALITGNTVIIKPPETSSLSTCLLGEVCQEVMPPGVVNIVTGLGQTAGDAIVRHPSIKRIVFTGSIPTGMAIQRSAAEVGVKHVTLELGGKNAFIVYPDVDVDAVADAAVAGMNFSWSGQSCGSTSRLMVHESLYERTVQAVAKRVALIQPGDPHSMQTRMGPLNSQQHHERVMVMIGSGMEEGARLVTGGQRPVGPAFSRGYWIQPTVFADVKPEMRIAREEIFGPVLAISSWRDESEVLDAANALEYGLTGAVWTRDITKALTMARRLRAGTVWVNGVGTHFKGCPYGGYKNSGIGRESCIEELLSYTETKAIHVLL